MIDIEPLVSVIVPCYNVEKYLPKCVDSIVGQTYRNLEIILVDDGSPDNCGNICDEYATRDGRIKVIHKENGGLSDARNAAIDVAKGEWLTFVDSDDYVTEDYVETLLRLCLKYEVKMAVGCCFIFSEGTHSIIHQKKINGNLLSKQEALSTMFYQKKYDVTAWGKIYQTSLFEEIRYPKGLLFEDLPTTFKLMLNCNEGVAYTNKQIYYYMFRPDSIEGSKFSEKKMDSAIEVFRIMQSYENELKEVTDALKSKLASFCFHLVLKMPQGYERGELLFDYIRQVRWDVMTNSKARLKTRLGCAATYLGFDFTKWLFRWVDRRKES